MVQRPNRHKGVKGDKVGKKLIIPEGTDVDKLVIAPGTRIGDLIYLSGSAGYDSAKGALAGDDIESQARQAMENLGRVLKAAGSSWKKVVKVNCFLVHAQRDFAGWNKVWKDFLYHQLFDDNILIVCENL